MWDEHADILAAVDDLCRAVRNAVRPLLGSMEAKGIEGRGASGDTTFGIDEVAEAVVSEFLAGRQDLAYYSEDRGLVAGGSPEYLLVIDPIDGTRPAAAGLECCCVSVAAARVRGDVPSMTLGDVTLGALYELKNDASYVGLRGGGARLEYCGEPVKPALSSRAGLEAMFWTIGFRGRPAEPMMTVLGELVDRTSVDGGIFDLGSACFCIARVLTGEMDVYIDVGQRMADEVPAVRERFLEIGHGAILNNYSYDLAAAALVAAECGAVVTDAYGAPIEPYPLIPSGGGGQISAVIAGNKDLHTAAMEEIERGMERLRGRYG